MPTPSMAPAISTPSRSRLNRLMPPPDVPASASAHLGKDKGKGKGLSDPFALSASPVPHHLRSKKVREAVLEPDGHPPAKRRKVEPNGSSPSTSDLRPTRRPTNLVSPGVQRHKSRKGKESEKTQPPPVPSSPSVKRIKLIVRRPDPVYSSPKQRPDPPPFGSSLTALLSSYHVLDGNDVTEDDLDHHVQQRAVFWRRVDQLRTEGRFFPEGMGDDSQPVPPSRWDPTMNQSQDAWAHIIEVVQERAVHKPPSGRQVAAQVASRVRAYWESRAVKDDKLKLQEEKRLRALAKATIKQVVEEWKKAVHVCARPDVIA